MVAVLDLWLPILLSAVFVFIASSVIHMVVEYHKGDYKKFPNEESTLDALRAQSVPPGDYMFPCAASMKDMGTPEMVEKFEKGPVGFVTVLPSRVPNIGKSLGQWFVYTIVIGVFVAYAGGLGLDPGAGGMDVFRLTGAVAVLAYAAAPVPESIWKGVAWGVATKFIVDGIIYGVVTAATFAWLWPAAS